MNNYVNAPGTKMLASHCAVCGRPLLDAESVEKGIGPDCRKRYGYDVPADDAARKEANGIVFQIAMLQKGREAFDLCRKLFDLGWVTLAQRILHRLTRIEIVEEPNGLTLRAPYQYQFSGDLRAKLPKAAWHRQKKVWIIPAPGNLPAAKLAVHACLVKHFPGQWATGPKGPFVVPDGKPETPPSTPAPKMAEVFPYGGEPQPGVNVPEEP